MEILAPDSLSSISSTPYDPRENRSFLEKAATWVAGTHDIGAAYDAARSQAELVAGAHNLRDVRSNIYDDIIGQVREASGVNLESPLDNGWPQQQQIAQLRRDREAAGFDSATSADDAAAGFFAQREADFMQQLRDLKQQQPDKMVGIDVDTPISERIAQRFGAANEGLAKASADPQLGGLPQFAAETLGSMVGSRGDPNFWYSWALPGGGAGKAAWSRIGSAALTQGLGMAAMTALQQPATQALRAQAGLENNALEEIAAAGLGGALIGGGAHAVLSETVPALRRVLAGDARPADFEAAAAAGVHVDEPTQQAIAQEANAVRASAETLKAPETVPEGTARTAFAEGLTHAEDPNAPPPLVDRPVPPGTTDDLARKVVGEAQSPGEAIDALKAHDLAYEPAEFDAKIAERARAAAPEVFRQADELDNTIASLRQQISDAVSAPPAAEVTSGRAAVLQAQLDDVQQQLGAITGKRRSSPRAKALRDQAAQLADEIERARASAEQDASAAAARESARIQTMRLYLNEKINDRARLGPEISSARAAAEAEAEAIGVRRGAIASALSSQDPEIRDLGRLASLGDEALKLVRGGDVDPLHGVIVAGSSHDPALQAELLSVIKTAKPQTVEEARQVVTEHLAVKSAREAAAVRMGGGDQEAVPASVSSAEIIAATKAKLRRWKEAAPQRTVEAVSAAAPANQARLAEAAARIAEEVGVKFINPGVKKPELVREKFVRKEYEHAGEITDAVRGGFEVATPVQADSIVTALGKVFDVLDEGWKVTDEGYFDRKVLVRFSDGQIGEVQMLEPNVLAAKKNGGHSLYEEYRKLPFDDPRGENLLTAQRALYSAALSKADPAFANALSGSGGSSLNTRWNSSLDMSGAEWATSASETRFHDPRTTAQASTHPGAEASSAGRPSQSQYESLIEKAPQESGSQHTSDVNREGSEMINQVPVTRPDGTVAFLSRADLQFAAARERFMADVVQACKS